jgi:RNA polymerase sigma factor (sigma-70 family)
VRSLKYRETDTGEDFQEPADPSDNLEQIRIVVEQQQAVRDSVDELTGRCRELVRMLYFEMRQFTYEEIGERMGIPVASVGPTRARCLEKLRTILRRRGIK